MRYLSPAFVVSTLKRGIEVWMHDRVDCGDEQFTDLVMFPALGGDDPDHPAAIFDDPEEALAYAHANLGAILDRWTNEAVCHDDYADFVRAGRPAQWPTA